MIAIPFRSPLGSPKDVGLLERTKLTVLTRATVRRIPLLRNGTAELLHSLREALTSLTILCLLSSTIRAHFMCVVDVLWLLGCILRREHLTTPALATETPDFYLPV